MDAIVDDLCSIDSCQLSAVRCGEKVMKSWIVHNTGMHAWGENITLIMVGGNLPMKSCSPALVPDTCVGEAACLSVFFVPPHPGSFISFWSLRDRETGKYFGPKLWFEILCADRDEISLDDDFVFVSRLVDIA